MVIVMLKFLNENSGEIITGIFGIVGIFISSILTKRKYQSEERKSLRLENEKLKEELNQLKDITAIDKALDKTHGSIYYETMTDGSRRSLCAFCWEQSHKRIPLKIQDSSNRSRNLIGFCQVCKATCNDTLEPHYSNLTKNNRTFI